MGGTTGASNIENWEIQDEPPHLRTIHDRLLSNVPMSQRLLTLCAQLLADGQILGDGSLEQMELRLSGLVVEHNRQLLVYNRIDAAIFRHWLVDQ